MLTSRMAEKTEYPLVTCGRAKVLVTEQGPLMVWGPVTPAELDRLEMDEGLHIFRPPAKQKQALREIADSADGRVFVARNGGRIVAYITFHYPEPFERWGKSGRPEILELGAIEVSLGWRRCGTGSALLEVAFGDWVEDYIIIGCEYCWHWDLKGTGMSVWGYRKMMQRFFERVGMNPVDTDDPEICDHPANMLVARIGCRVPEKAVQVFNGLRFCGRRILL